MPRSSQSRAALLDAAAQEFAARGYHGAGVDRIADRACVNKRMIYHHFGDKAGLFRQVLADRLGGWQGDALDEADAALLLAEAEYVRDGGEAVLLDGRRGALSSAFADRHAGVQYAVLGVRLLPLLLPQLKSLLGTEPDAGLAEQVGEVLERASEKRRVTLKAHTSRD